VTIDGAPAAKPATQVHAGQALVIRRPPRRFVSRGGEKLDHAIARFGVAVTGRICLDAGVSTGGFTDRLLQGGAARVYAFDVGYGQVHERIRTDERVHVRERTNIRDVAPEDLPGPPADLVVCDVSFIALKTVLPALRPLASRTGEAITLVKPQFEAARSEVGRGGVVRSPEVWHRVLTEVADAAATLGWSRFDAVASPLIGPAGNVEFLAHLQVGDRPEIEDVVTRAVTEGVELREREG